MRFSELYGVTDNDQQDDWFDPLLITDTRLYVDPTRRVGSPRSPTPSPAPVRQPTRPAASPTPTTRSY